MMIGQDELSYDFSESGTKPVETALGLQPADPATLAAPGLDARVAVNGNEVEIPATDLHSAVADLSGLFASLF